jgi:hypothetical protein
MAGLSEPFALFQNLRACRTSGKMFSRHYHLSAKFLGYFMDSTATNKVVIQVLQDEDPAKNVIPCASHALSLVLKHPSKHFK